MALTKPSFYIQIQYSERFLKICSLEDTYSVDISQYAIIGAADKIAYLPKLRPVALQFTPFISAQDHSSFLSRYSIVHIFKV